ncbi:NUDIX domain-containing protein, partial [Acinetobacter baumannii]|uniref:NUDIX domain-containing protein n=1 Tax=Acinetobacter baumannii TaxID=470 RepID=UPI0034D723B5
MLVLDEALDTYLVGQFRFTLGAYSWEIPEGGCPINMDPLEGGKRELLEETGLVASEWTELFRMHLSNSVSDE